MYTLMMRYTDTYTDSIAMVSCAMLVLLIAVNKVIPRQSPVTWVSLFIAATFLQEASHWYTGEKTFLNSYIGHEDKAMVARTVSLHTLFLPQYTYRSFMEHF